MSNTLQRTVNLTSTFTANRPFSGVNGYQNEPALSIGDWVRQFILAPPFAWRWNRKSTTFSTVAGQQDYEEAVIDFGWLEKATTKDASGNFKELDVLLDIADEGDQDAPRQIAAQLDDGAGNITFRLFPVPDAVYTVTVIYQKAAPSFIAVNGAWSPLPDYLSYLYNQGFQAKFYEYSEDLRFPEAMQLFIRQVIAANTGLSDSQRNIFMTERIISQVEAMNATGKTQLALQARSNV